MNSHPRRASLVARDGAVPACRFKCGFADTTSRFGAPAAIMFAALAALILAAAPAMAATIINSARIDRLGPVVEMRFGLAGRGLQWNLSTHGNQLLLDLNHARIALPPRPFYGHETPPVAALYAIDTSGMRARIVIAVSGRTDYSVGRIGRELVIRLTRSGAGPIPPGEAGGIGPRAAKAAVAAAEMPRRASSGGDTSARGESLAAPARATPAASIVVVPPAVSGADTIVRSAPAAPPAASPLVVIDPGHGGFDAGTEVASPILEKDIALQISLRLAHELQRRGTRVILTRSGDYFLTLGQRTTLANNSGADLFVSIHLNSSPNPEDSGIETYYLNNTTDRATIRLARMENGGQAGYSRQSGPDLNFILSDMRQQYKANEAVTLASTIQEQTALELDRSFSPEVRAGGPRHGPFYVLVGARMPAVLVECGFLSNPPEAARLESPAYQQVLAAGIADAVTRYFSSDASVGNL